MTDIDKLAREMADKLRLEIGVNHSAVTAAVKAGILEGERRGMEKAIAIMDSDDVAEAMDCNKAEKYAVHKSTLELAKSAIRSAL